jgi:hypothetical protein
MRIDKINVVTPLYQFNVLNNAETTFDNIPSMKQVFKPGAHDAILVGR